MIGNPDIVMTKIYDLVHSLALYGYNRFIRPRYRPGLIYCSYSCPELAKAYFYGLI